MIAVIQRVAQASVTIGHNQIAVIGNGLLILLGIEHNDDEEDVQWLVRKVINLRIFGDTDGKMNKSLLDVQGELLIVSQFTLHASTKKGNRPSFIDAAPPDRAIPLYQRFIEVASAAGCPVKTGEFGTDMKVGLVNDGPVTVIIDTKNKQ